MIHPEKINHVCHENDVFERIEVSLAPSRKKRRRFCFCITSRVWCLAFVPCVRHGLADDKEMRNFLSAYEVRRRRFDLAGRQEIEVSVLGES